jgi:hypothetical protein
MMNLLNVAATKLVVAVNGGSIVSKNSALFNPNFKYSHHQIVVGVVFDAIVCTLLMGAMFYAAYLYWGPPAKRKLAAQGGIDDSTTLRQEGMLLGIQPWIWSIISCAGLAIAVLSSVIYYG